MPPDFDMIDKIANKYRQVGKKYLSATSEFIANLKSNGYIRYTFGDYENYREVLIHSSVNPHQIYENGDIHGSLDPRLSFEIE